MHIKVVEYDSNWKVLYENEKKNIEHILGIKLIAVHHIGSTAVEGLKAKPIIDIMLVLREIEDIDAFNKQFETLGYECMGEFGITGRRYFRKGGDNRTHQLHAFGESSQHDIIRHLAVRDYLREHPTVVREYGDLKAKLALDFPESIDAYCDGKEEFVKNLEKNALEWSQNK